jgi:hypothetical protein
MHWRLLNIRNLGGTVMWFPCIISFHVNILHHDVSWWDEFDWTLSYTVYRFRCQGKPICQIKDVVLFNETSPGDDNVPGNTSPVAAYIRQNVTDVWGGLTRCQAGCAYFQPSYTCYCVTSQTGLLEQVRDECRARGGELARLFVRDSNGNVKSAFVKFLLENFDFFYGAVRPAAAQQMSFSFHLLLPAPCFD